MRLTLFHRSLIVLGCILVAAPLVVVTAGRSLESMYNSPVMWIPPQSEQRRRFFEFVDDFRAADVILVSWQGCTVDDERLDRFAAALARADGGHSGVHSGTLFDRVLSGRSSLLALQSPPLELSRRQAMRRLRGSLIGPDDVSCAIAVLTPNGAVRRDTAIAMVRSVLQDELELSAQQTRVGGTPVIGKAIDDASVHSMLWLSLPSTAVIVLLCGLFLRSWRMILLVLGVGFFGEQLAISLVELTGHTMNAVFVVMSPLVFVLSASTGIHLCNYYRDEVDARGRSGAAERMLRIGWKPCLLSATTTAAGLLSLLVSEITAVRQFAMISAGCVLLTTLLMLLTLPGVLQRWPPATRVRSGWTVRWLSRLASVVAGRRTLVAVAGLSVMAAAALGLGRLRTTVQVFDLLTDDHPVIQDHRWLESQVLPLVPVETVARFDAASPLTLFDRLRLVRQLHASAASGPPARGATSALTFLPSLPTSNSVRASVQRTVIAERFSRDRVSLAELGYLRETPEAQSWRITTRVPAFEQVDASAYLSDLAAAHAAVLDRAAASRDDVSVTVTGVMPVIESAQQMLLQDLIGSFFTAMLVIAAVIIIALRSVPLGLLAMIPNVFPICVLFGLMGWMDRPLDIGVMMTASVALGIAVDDTVHFLLYWRRELAGDTRAAVAVARTITHCGNAITQTTVVCGLGLLVFAWSDFEPTRRFAWMMFLLLSAALVADLMLLPALLCGRHRKDSRLDQL
ncbi:efflux RND transporter permease subunit [Rhodopirellula sp. JC639]|uniref:efflux RND transporter permease subunit n=1 Tax=Stieleria mannarensis TaxID=2755585 RepID=UPI0016027AD4|nr:MMPL family transporter [Rhodopirellula sp. JC639]